MNKKTVNALLHSIRKDRQIHVGLSEEHKIYSNGKEASHFYAYYDGIGRIFDKLTDAIHFLEEKGGES
jgi:hypothetical protein